MKIDELKTIDYGSFSTLYLKGDKEAIELALADIVKMQDNHNQLMEVINKQAILLNECLEFVDAELKESIKQLNQL
jgi:hypothetical protein